MKFRKFKKPCRDENCGKMFRPTGNSCRYCPSCVTKRKKAGLNIMRMNNHKRRISKIRERCVVCQRKINRLLRSSNAITCSRKCSRYYQYEFKKKNKIKKTGYKLKVKTDYCKYCGENICIKSHHCSGRNSFLYGVHIQREAQRGSVLAKKMIDRIIKSY